MKRGSKLRSGVAAVEFAIVAPALIFLILGAMIGGLGVFRYQQIANLAREASRYASVHGAQYSQETGLSAATASSIYNAVIAPKAVALDLNKLSYTITWNTSNSPTRTAVNGSGQLASITNTVQVTINYQWIPEGLASGVTLTSTSVTPMAY